MAFQILLGDAMDLDPERRFRELILGRVDSSMVTIARELYCVAYSPTYKRRKEAGLPVAVTWWLNSLSRGNIKSQVPEACWQAYVRLPQHEMSAFLKDLEVKCWPNVCKPASV